MSPAQSWAFPLHPVTHPVLSLPSGQPGEVPAQTQRRLGSKVRGSVWGEVRGSKQQDASEGTFRITLTGCKGETEAQRKSISHIC